MPFKITRKKICTPARAGAWARSQLTRRTIPFSLFEHTSVQPVRVALQGSILPEVIRLNPPLHVLAWKTSFLENMHGKQYEKLSFRDIF